MSPSRGSSVSRSTDFRVVRGHAHLSFAAEGDGGLCQPLALPTQSIVFKFDDGKHAGSGVVAIVGAAGVDSVSAGSVLDAEVTFPDAPAGEEFRDRAFRLWIGRDIGSAVITAVEDE